MGAGQGGRQHAGERVQSFHCTGQKNCRYLNETMVIAVKILGAIEWKVFFRGGTKDMKILSF